MSSDQGNMADESNTDYADWMMYGYHDFNHSEPTYYLTKPTGTIAVLKNIIMIVFYPTILISNGILLAMILKNKRIRSEPWRWLIAHTSLCIFVTSFFLWINLFTAVYLLPSFETTVICPAVKVIEALFWQMYPISVTLVAIERYRVIKQDNWKSDGMGKKAVIISLAVFWIANILLHVIVSVIPIDRPYMYYHEGLPDTTICGLHFQIVIDFAKLIVTVWSFFSMIVVIIGSSVSTCKKSNIAMRRFVFVPTIIVAATYLLFYVSIEIMDMMISVGIGKVAVFFHLITVLAWIIFPLTWIIVWTKNGDVDWNRKFCPCCPDHSNEEIQLLNKDAQ